jgi:hypothetical protein
MCYCFLIDTKGLTGMLRKPGFRLYFYFKGYGEIIGQKRQGSGLRAQSTEHRAQRPPTRTALAGLSGGQSGCGARSVDRRGSRG